MYHTANVLIQPIYCHTIQSPTTDLLLNLRCMSVGGLFKTLNTSCDWLYYKAHSAWIII